jgi:hypothetical protein
VNRLLWVGAFVLAACVCAGALAGLLTGTGWGVVLAAVATEAAGAGGAKSSQPGALGVARAAAADASPEQAGAWMSAFFDGGDGAAAETPAGPGAGGQVPEQRRRP